MTLYEIQHDIEETLLSGVDPETGEISPEISQRLDELQMAKEEKIENTALFIKNLDAEAAAIEAEEKALKSRRERSEKLAERLRGYLGELLGGQKVSSPRFSISWRKSEGVKVTDEEQLIQWAAFDHDDLLTYKPPTLNKTAIKKALKAGEVIPGAVIETRQNMILK